jgi:hypothetical protein
MAVRFPAAGRHHSLVSEGPNRLLALSLPLKPPRSPIISDIHFEKRCNSWAQRWFKARPTPSALRCASRGFGCGFAEELEDALLQHLSPAL